MLSRIAWEFCSTAFEASRQQSTARALRRSLEQWGAAWFWVALTLEGRALEVWRDYRAQALQGALRRPARAGEMPGELPVLSAWSLPNNPKMRGLGLGRVWVVTCPLCRRFHMHAPEEGHRPAHCHASALSPARYALRYAGELPRGLWDRFRLSVLAERPRLLRPPYRDVPDDMLEAA